MCPGNVVENSGNPQWCWIFKMSSLLIIFKENIIFVTLKIK